jgi:predicted component of type VI protein secretion system
MSVDSEPTITYVPMDPSAPPLTPDEAAHLSGFSGFALVAERGPRAGQTWVLPLGTASAGRAPDADIFLDDVTVSRDHCRFTVEPQGILVEDLGSTNGTYVNGDRVDRAQLKPGDEVIIGRFHMLVALGDE